MKWRSERQEIELGRAQVTLSMVERRSMVVKMWVVTPSSRATIDIGYRKGIVVVAICSSLNILCILVHVTYKKNGETKM